MQLFNLKLFFFKPIDFFAAWHRMNTCHNTDTLAFTIKLLLNSMPNILPRRTLKLSED